MPRHLLNPAALIAAFALASCSSGATHQSAAAPDLSPVAGRAARQSAKVIAKPSDFAKDALSDATVLPSNIQSSMDRAGAFRQVSALAEVSLPPLPGDAEIERQSSAAYQLALNAPYDDSGNVTATPTKLTLNSTPGSASWAIFQVPITALEYANSLNFSGSVTNAANGIDSGLWICLAKYDEDRWVFAGPKVVGASSSQPISPAFGYTSPGSNVYFAVLAWNGDVIELDSLTLNTTGSVPSLLPDEFGFALSNIGMGLNEIGMDQLFNGLTGANEWTWNGWTDLWTMMDTYWNAWYAAPEDFPQYISDQGDALGAAQSIQELLLEATDEFQAEHKISAQTHSETLDPAEPLAKAIADFVSSAGGTPDQATYDSAVGALDLADQNALAIVVEAARQAFVDRNTTMDNYNTNVFGGSLDGPTLDSWFAATQGAWLSNALWLPLVYDVSSNFRFLRSFPYEGFFTPSARLADAIDDLTDYVATAPVWEDVNLDVPTPAGNITIGGTGVDNFTSPGANGHLLLIDLGGSDIYDCNAGGTASYTNGLSVCIDFEGNDIYDRMDDPSSPDRSVTPCDDNTSQQGAGRYGIGMLVDYSGNDEYYSVRMSQGSAVMGVGILADMAGNDLYMNEALCLGAAYGGVGLCFDASGDDEYRTISLGGGFGGIMGVGFLVDQGSGLDTYYAEPDANLAKPEYISPQDAAKNSCFAFGAGFGKRWSDPGIDPVVGSGGLGFCFDAGGDDTYTCGVFGQGFGFYQAVGICFDAGGTDTHTGWWYTQGATAHVAVGALWDGSGNDSYHNDRSVGIGGAHDWSISWLLERDGDDIYQGSNLCLGRGFNNANGFFVDWLGADTYTPLEADGENYTLGRGGDPATGRETQATVGVLVDVAGADTYDALYANMLSGQDPTDVINTPPGNQVTWLRDNGNVAAGHGFYQLGHGVGYDGGS